MENKIRIETVQEHSTGWTNQIVFPSGERVDLLFTTSLINVLEEREALQYALKKIIRSTAQLAELPTCPGCKGTNLYRWGFIGEAQRTHCHDCDWKEEAPK